MGEWISVEERLPIDFQGVLAVLDGDVYQMYFTGERWKVDGIGSPESTSYDRVTHWMPLPEPPK